MGHVTKAINLIREAKDELGLRELSRRADVDPTMPLRILQGEVPAIQKLAALEKAATDHARLKRQQERAARKEA